MADVGPTTHTLDVPGARLCYDIRGSGPLLLMIGSPMGSRGFTALASLLAADFTVVTYDPRGILRSTISDPGQKATPELIADDVQQLIAALDAGPAHVFGNSGGATTGLALVARHPDAVRTLVAHEPPVTELLPDGQQVRTTIDDLCKDYTAGHRDVALRKYSALSGVGFAPPPPVGQASTRALYTPPKDVRAILDRFFGYILQPTTRYRPDLDALRTASVPVVVGGGTTSQGQLYHRTATALAELLDTPLAAFPAGHTGFQEQPEPFADLLREAFGTARTEPQPRERTTAPQ
ncbi:alpha/beta fold hydrolase [Streptomyces rishiriensis]|uniref:Clorobiocin biosynthesis protein CloN7 n=1 Tax=Streptomyces rishiriensis TaxID=68264 RepID=A0ABU0P2L2_STRRH|nr:alpha/beta hydrolase [Streptomyces rishiriensis]MDQ0585636.1 clorobiocin biosynthesis protein CloN7 [Streptomyces rishiriensis]